MGQDKAGLVIEGETLWRRQIATLQAAGASEILISGRPDGPYAESGFRIIQDVDSDLGPMGGIFSAFQSAQHSIVLVLGIDLPRMSGEYLRSLLPKAPVVPRRGERFEPVAAIYSRRCLEVFSRRLSQRQLSLQAAVRELVQHGDLSACEVAAEDVRLFDNLNTPEDLAYFVRSSGSGK